MPALTEEMKRMIDEKASECPHTRCACLDALQLAERRNGWISDEVLREVAAHLDMTPAELESAASFYNHLYRKPVGRHVILVCDSVSCWIMGYERVLRHLEKRLGIGMGMTTPDGVFTLLPIQCLGACDKAPAIMIDESLYTDLDEAKIDSILDRYRRTSD